jgi:hypothetical protein
MKTSSRIVPALVCCLLAALVATASAREHKKPQPYALIYGTVYGPDDLPVEGVHVRIRKKDDKKPKYEQYSDHRGEFAQRVPPGPADYVVYADLKGAKTKLKPGKEAEVHFAADERQDVSLHLVE